MCGKLVVFVLTVFVLHEATCLKIPSYFKQCYRNDPNFNNCARINGQESFKGLVNGDRKYKIPSLNPLHLPELYINQNENLKIRLIDAKFDGLANTKIQSCNFDFNKKLVTIDITIPQLTVNAMYEMSGKILILPISGKGPSSLTLNNLKFSYTHGFDIVNKSGVEYMVPQKGKIDYEISGLKLHFDNLFNGDKVLGEETNNFLNENWKEVSQELGPGVAEALVQVAHLIIKNVCDLVPFNDLFPLK